MLLSSVISIIVMILSFNGLMYATKLPQNSNCMQLWMLIIFVMVLGTIVAALFSNKGRGTGTKISFAKIVGASTGVLIILFIILSCSSSRMFNAKTYASRITVETGDFDKDIPKTADLKKIPLMDSETSAIMGNRAIGDLSDVVSQYQLLASEYSTIVYNKKVVKVAPLEYGNLFKWWKNRSKGIPGYVIVDPETNSAEYVKLDEPIHYSMNAYFSDNVLRHVRRAYPTKMFGNGVFQLKEDGTPVWTIMTYENEAFFDAWKADGMIIVNASSGETEWRSLKDIPEWVESLLTGDNMESLYNDYGQYKNGYWNAQTSQNNCTVTTNDFGYLAIDDDIYYYTGVTSVAADNSNIGFLLVNSRTAEFTYYASSGADEHSAMSAAEGALQNYGYIASFPSLINVSGEPVYAMALKDVSGLVKAYAFVNEKHYTVVGTGNTLNEAMNDYKANMSKNGYDLHEFTETDKVTTKTEVISDIQFIVRDGTTITYIRTASGSLYKELFDEKHLFMNIGDAISVNFNNDALKEIAIQAVLSKK